MGGYSRAVSVKDSDDEDLVRFDFGDIEMDYGQPELSPLDELPPVADVAQTPEQTHSRSSESDLSFYRCFSSTCFLQCRLSHLARKPLLR